MEVDFLHLATQLATVTSQLANLTRVHTNRTVDQYGTISKMYDQFVDGSQAVIIDGDYKVNKWFSIGTVLTYNINRDKFVRNEVRAEIGPQDFKIRLGYDMVRNQFDLGVNVLYGEPIKYDNLRLKI